MKRRSLLLCLALAMSLAAAISGTLAYLTDEETTTNVMTVGNVDIKLTEWERKNRSGTEDESELTYAPGVSEDAQEKIQPFVNHTQPLYPAVIADGASTTAAGNSATMWSGNSVVGVVDKIVRVENVGTSDAYFRTVIAVQHIPQLDGKDMLHINWNQKDYAVTEGPKGGNDEGRKGL